jgi:ferredoxin-thioredoxin reductase catalytic subunit
MRENQTKEALERMVMLNMSRQCINAFKKGKIWESEGYGALYELNEKEQVIVDAFEKKYNAVAYHLIHNLFEFGECYSILYVSQDKSEWQEDRYDIEDGSAFVYVVNVDDKNCSEFGTIGIRPQFGGLVRIW